MTLKELKSYHAYSIQPKGPDKFTYVFVFDKYYKEDGQIFIGDICSFIVEEDSTISEKFTTPNSFVVNGSGPIMNLKTLKPVDNPEYILLMKKLYHFATF